MMKRLKFLFLLFMVGVTATISAARTSVKTKLVIKSGEKSIIRHMEKGKTPLMFTNAVQTNVLIPAAEKKQVTDLVLGAVNNSNYLLFSEKHQGETAIFELEGSDRYKVAFGDPAKLTRLQQQEDLKRSRIKIKKGSKGFAFSLSKKPEKVRYFTLNNPDRMVFDFIGITGEIVSSGNLKKVRSANHPSGFRVVIENTLPEYFSLTALRNNILMNFKQSRQYFTAFKKLEINEKKKKQIAKKAEKKTPSPEKKVKNSVERIEIEGVAFVGESPGILTLNGSGSFKITKKQKGNKLHFFIPNSFMSEDKEQLIDAASLNGPVKEIAIFNDNGGVSIIAKMQNDLFVYDIHKGENRGEIIFAQKAQSLPKEAVAGYSESVKSAVVPAITGRSRYRGKKISLDFKGVDILDVLRLMSEISKLNIIAGDDVKGTITVRLINIPWDEALDVILRSKSLGKERFGNIIRVAHVKTLQREHEALLAKKKAQHKLEPVKVRLIVVNYAKASNLQKQIKDLLSDRGSVSVDERTNTLIVKDIQEALDKSEQLVQFLDTQTPQVLIEARIVEATSQAAQGLGVAWNTNNHLDVNHNAQTGLVFPYNMGMGGAVSVPGPADVTGTLGFTFGSVGNISDLSLTLNVMESEGKIKIVSSPKVATLDNSEAMIQQGVSIPITTRSQGGEVTTKFIDATLILKTTPHITPDGSIMMDMNINKSEPDWSNANYLGEPAIIKKEAKTEILIKSGDTLVIGGVYTNKLSKTIRKVPILGDIPLLGWLFKSEDERIERSELLIFLTPRIMNKVRSSIPLAQSDEE